MKFFYGPDDDPDSKGGFTAVSVGTEKTTVTFYNYKGIKYVSNQLAFVIISSQTEGTSVKELLWHRYMYPCMYGWNYCRTNSNNIIIIAGHNKYQVEIPSI